MMQMEQELLTKAYAAFNRRDIDGVLVLMQADVDWANGMDGGRVHGQENVREYWTRQWEKVDPTVYPVAMTRNPDGGVTVEVHQVVRDLAGTVLFDGMVQHVYTLREGLIARMEIREAAPEVTRGA